MAQFNSANSSFQSPAKTLFEVNMVATSDGNVVTSANPLPVTALLTEEPGEMFGLNNAATNVHRGWTMDDTLRPVISFRVDPTGTTIQDITKLIEYEIGNNNANQSTIVYEWWEGDIAISGAVPAWSDLNARTQYRVYQDKYGSNTGNTFTANGAKMRHTGIIIGKNSSADEGPSELYGGATPNMLTLCMARLDSGTKLDIWFAFTFKEI